MGSISVFLTQGLLWFGLHALQFHLDQGPISLFMPSTLIREGHKNAAQYKQEG